MMAYDCIKLESPKDFEKLINDKEDLYGVDATSRPLCYPCLAYFYLRPDEYYDVEFFYKRDVAHLFSMLN